MQQLAKTTSSCATNTHGRVRRMQAGSTGGARLMDRGTVVEGILILDADTLHPWVFRGIEG